MIKRRTTAVKEKKMCMAIDHLCKNYAERRTKDKKRERDRQANIKQNGQQVLKCALNDSTVALTSNHIS